MADGAGGLAGGTSLTGQALDVYYAVGADEVAQLAAVQTDGYVRQVTQDGPWGTSARMFRYDSSGDENQERSLANHLRTVGVAPQGRLQLTADYHNDAPTSGDQFDVHAEFLWEPPSTSTTAVTVLMQITNTSGRAVVPLWQGHRDLAQQWELFGLSSMYVADNLSGDIPAWYDELDPTHAYVGTIGDISPLNDGHSVQENVDVPTHDVKRITLGGVTTALDHDQCPSISVPGLGWYEELVVLDQPSRYATLEHLYDPQRNQRVEVLSAAGLTADTNNLKWAVTYDRDFTPRLAGHDPDMVDGDNVQVTLGMDDYLDAWPEGASQTVTIRLVTGPSFPFTIHGGQFLRDDRPVILKIINYSPMEPGQVWSDPLHTERLLDDLRRFRA